MPNDASVRLHERVGFRKVATFAHAGWKFGAWHDVAFFQLMLARRFRRRRRRFRGLTAPAHLGVGLRIDRDLRHRGVLPVGGLAS